ncbi:PhoH family protein [Tessaracoccus sp.]
MSGSPRKTFVLDTSVLLSAGRQAMQAFEEHEVVLPLVVVKELEAKRHDPELGLMARSALRFLEELRTRPGDDLKTGVTINEQGGTLRLEINHVSRTNLPDALKNDRSNDTRILAVASALAAEGKDVVLVSKDMPMRILAQTVLGIPAQEYRNEQVADSGYTGLIEVFVPQEQVDELYTNKVLKLDDPSHLTVNCGVVLNGALGVIDANKDIRLIHADRDVFGVSGRSAPQRIALDHLSNPDIHIVSMGGPAGTGKTLLALAAGLEAVLENHTHKKIMVFRPLFAVGGQELGFLPGDAAEKMNPWAAAIYDALSSFVTDTVMEEIKFRNLIEVLPLTHIRGRTLSDAWIVVDEAQNLERATLLTALSRLGAGSKAILSWDVAQRDNLHVGRHDGIHAVVEKLKGEHLFAHVNLTKSERSPAAALVSRLLDDMDA